MYKRICYACFFLASLSYALISHSQDAYDELNTDEISITAKAPNFVWYFASGFAVFVTAACTYLFVLLLKKKIDVTERQRFGLLIFSLSIPLIVMFAFFVEGFDGWIVYAILAAVIGFAAGNPFTLLNRNQNDDED